MARSEENLMLRLHDIQILLKRESILHSESEGEFAARLPEQRDSFLQILASRKLIFTSYQVLLRKDPPTLLLHSVCKLMLQRARGVCLTAAPIDLDLSRFASPSSLSAFCADFLANDKNDADLLTFSLVPSFFSCLWSDKSAESFVDFLCETARRSLPAAQTLGRALFALPEFGMFLSRVISDMKFKPHTLGDPSSPSPSPVDFSKEFVRSWTASAALCPAIVTNALSRFGDPVAFLRVAFIEPALAHPSVYLEPNCEWSDAMTIAVRKHLSESPSQLLASLKEVQFGVSIQSLETAPMVVLSSDDLRAMGENCDGYELFSTPASSSPPPASEPARVEDVVRDLLVDLRIIPMMVRTPDHPDLVSVLRQQVDLSRRDHKLRLSLKLRAVESALSETRTDFSRPWRLGDVIELLRRGFDSRQHRRLAALRLFCRLDTSRFQSSLERGLFAPACQIQAAILTRWHRSLDIHSLDRTFTIAQQWSNQRDLFDLEFAGLHDFLIRPMLFRDFTKCHQHWVVIDVREKQRMQRRRAPDPRSKAGRTDPWNALVRGNEQFEDRVLQGLRNCFAATTPVRSLLALADVIALCETVFRVAGVPQGGDALQKFLVVFLERIAPSEIVSWAAWIGKCFTGLYDKVVKERKPGVVSGCLDRVAPAFGKAIKMMYGFVADAVAEDAKKKGKRSEFEYVGT